MLRKDPFITGEYYHIYNRGIDKRVIFKSENDYKRFIMLLYICNSKDNLFRLDNLINQQQKEFNEIMILDRGELIVSIGAWCLMNNHFHLLIKQEIDGGITKFMRKLGTGYSMFFNIKYLISDFLQCPGPERQSGSGSMHVAKGSGRQNLFQTFQNVPRV